MSALRFRINVQDAATHRIGVEVTFHGVGDDAELIARLPVWSPGSYFVREYAQHISNVHAWGDDDRPRPVKKTEKSSWRVDCRDTKTVTLSYTVFGHDLGVRNNHFDDTHAFITPAASLMYVDERFNEPVEVEVTPPPGWTVFTGLRRPVEGKAFFIAKDFDELYDCPLEVGPHTAWEIQVRETPHRFVAWGSGNLDQRRLERDLPKIIEANAEVFGPGLPYEDYLTICMLTDSLYGGLEHRNSTALMYPRHEFDSGKSLDPPIEDDKYINFLSLFAHEHFHVWHVKRIRPERLGPFDYQRENLTRDIWTIEGITSYYNDLTLLRAGLIAPAKFLSLLADNIKRLESIPGRHEESIEESSFNAWIGIYRPHENSVNASVSYYLKGAIVSVLLDVFLRTETAGEKSLDDVLRYLWHHHSKERGYPEGSLETIIEDATGVDVRDVFDILVRGTEDPDYTDYFEGIGLELVRQHKEKPGPWVGVNTKEESGRCVITQVRSDGPAHGKLYAGDEIVAVGGWRVRGNDLNDRLRVQALNRPCVFHVARREEILELPVVIREEPFNDYLVRVRKDITPAVKDVLVDWLGALPETNKEKS